MRVSRPFSHALAAFFATTLFACSTVKKIDQIGITDRIVQLRKPAMVYGFDEQLRRDRYVHNLRGMWLAESIGSATARKLAARRTEPPFLTGREAANASLELADPWFSDENTDFEYLYLQAIHERQTGLLTPEALAHAWAEGIDGEKHVSAAQLRVLRLLRKGVSPTVTGLAAVNGGLLAGAVAGNFMRDAQVATEFFGALAPGIPERALRLADLPIRMMAVGSAAHAAQFNVLLYSLAPVVKKSMSGREKVLWLAREARKYLPETSKAAGIFDFVLAGFLRRCPDAGAKGCGEWEDARDALYERYQRDAEKFGFTYRGPEESAINFGAGVLALLYGQGNFKRTVQIATLAGWAADGSASTMAGLLGLMNGYDWIVAQFPKTKLSDRYGVYRTRSAGLPDFLPGDPMAEDTFLMMAIRMTPFVEESIKAGGGSIRELNYLVPKLPEQDQLALSPTERLYRASANNRVRANGGEVAAFSSAVPEPGSDPLPVIADGIEHDFSGFERTDAAGVFVGRGALLEAGVEYDRPVALKRLRLITGATGAFREAKAQYLRDGEWADVPPATVATAFVTGQPNQIIDWLLPEPIETRGIRLQGVTKAGIASIIELDALSE